MAVNGFLVNNEVQKYNYESLENYNTPDFSTSSTYEVGDYVMYQGKLYKCTTEITTSGGWDSSKWSLAILSDDVATLRSSIESGGYGLSESVKQALLQIASKVAYIDDQGQTYYDDLYDALYPLNVVSITAVYTQSGVVLNTDTLDSLKADLVVTATYSDSSTQTVPAANYTLSGTLATGTSTITVSYANKTTTFTVTVSGYVTDGLIMWLDGERNGVDGVHTSPMSTWVDQTGNGWDWDNMGATVAAKAISFSGSSQYLKRAYNDLPTNVAMIEVVFSSPHTSAGLVLSGFGDTKPGNILMGSSNSVLLHSGTDKNTWTKIPENEWGDIHSYSSGGYRDGVYNVEASVSSSWQYLYPAIGCYLGASGTNPEYPFKGSIYCIRLYSRVLTEAEILSNYAIDAARFGIGG